MKKEPAKKKTVKTAAKTAPKKAAKPAPKKAPAKVSKRAEKSPCSCGEQSCSCSQSGSFCFESLIQETFGKLSDTERVADLLKDYFFTELLSKGVEEPVANALANRLDIKVSDFEVNIELLES